jgi:hypothetical protein
VTAVMDLCPLPLYAMSALELSKNAKAAAQYSILKRLSKSLLQYIERDGALFYVGLIGHFSAGKTSSINSLLQTWATEFERKTDFHPTDKTITLITREKNADWQRFDPFHLKRWLIGMRNVSASLTSVLSRRSFSPRSMAPVKERARPLSCARSSWDHFFLARRARTRWPRAFLTATGSCMPQLSRFCLISRHAHS